MIRESVQRFPEKITRNKWQEAVSSLDTSIAVEVISGRPVVT